MIPQPSNPPDPNRQDDDRLRDHLANERTFLAWIRTSIALIGLGFVLARMGLFLRHLALEERGLGGGLDHPPVGEFATVGVAFLIAGTALAGWAAWQHRRISRAISSHTFEATDRSVWVLAALVVGGGIVIAAMVIGRVAIPG